VLACDEGFVIDVSMATLIGGGVGLFAAGLLVGGFWFRRRDEDRTRAVRLEKDLADARAEHERYRASVSEHFARSSDLFRDLTNQYTSLYRHLAEGARDLGRPDLPAFEGAPEPPRLESQALTDTVDSGAEPPRASGPQRGDE
jgi:uncharacterized membrane-anchored protein YhcB (DUF1043 family)